MKCRFIVLYLFCLLGLLTGMSNAMEQDMGFDSKSEELEEFVTIEFEQENKQFAMPHTMLVQSNTCKNVLDSFKGNKVFISENAPVTVRDFKGIEPLLKILAEHTSDEAKTYNLEQRLEGCTIQDLASLYATVDFLDVPFIEDIIADEYFELDKKIIQELRTADDAGRKLAEWFRGDNFFNVIQSEIAQRIKQELSFFATLPIKITTTKMSVSRHINEYLDCLSSDGKYVVHRRDSIVDILDAKTGKHVKTFPGHTAEVDFVRFSPGGTYIVSLSGDKTMRLWDVTTGKCIKVFHYKEWLAYKSICFSSDDRYIFFDADGCQSVFDIVNDNIIKEFRCSELTKSACFSPDNKYIVVVYCTKIEVWNIENESGESLKQRKIRDARFCCDGKYIAFMPEFSKKLTINFWDIETGNRIETDYGEINISCFSSDEKCIALVSDGKIELWDIETSKCIKTFIGHENPVKSVCFSLDDRYIVSTDQTTIKIWDANTGHCIKEYFNHIKGNPLIAENVNGAFFGPDDTSVIFASNNVVNNVIKLWDIRSLCAMYDDFKALTLAQTLLLYALEKNLIAMQDINANAVLNDIFNSLTSNVQKQYDRSSKFKKLCIQAKQSLSHVKEISHNVAGVLVPTAYNVYKYGTSSHRSLPQR